MESPAGSDSYSRDPWLLHDLSSPIFMRFFDTASTWIEAEAVCRKHFGHLVRGKYLSTVFESHSNCLIWIFQQFCPIKRLSGSTVCKTASFSFPKLDKLTIFGFFQWFSYTVVCKQKRIFFLDFVILRISWKYRIPPRLLVKVFAQKIHSLAKVTVTYKSFRLEEGSIQRALYY